MMSKTEVLVLAILSIQSIGFSFYFRVFFLIRFTENQHWYLEDPFKEQQAI